MRAARGHHAESRVRHARASRRRTFARCSIARRSTFRTASGCCWPPAWPASGCGSTSRAPTWCSCWPPTSAAGGERWFLLGGQGDVAAAGGARPASASFPGLQIAGAHARLAPGRGRRRHAGGDRRAAGRVDVLLVAYGAPKQEHWLDRNLAALGIPVGIGVGGVFNYLSGDAPRAPRWVRRLHFEWAAPPDQPAVALAASAGAAALRSAGLREGLAQRRAQRRGSRKRGCRSPSERRRSPARAGARR